MNIELSTEARQDLTNQSIQLMKEGRTNSSIIKHIKSTLPGITVAESREIVAAARQLVTQEYSATAKDIQIQHTARYNENITRLLQVEELSKDDIGNGISYETWLASRHRKIQAYDEALRSIVQKENLLQMDSSTFTFDIEENHDITFQESEKPKYDITKLTFKEQCELYELVKLARIGEIEANGIKSRTDEDTVENADVEVISDQPPNITMIEQKQSAIDEQESSQISHIDKLKERLKQQAAKKFQDAGAHLSDQEEQYLN